MFVEYPKMPIAKLAEYAATTKPRRRRSILMSQAEVSSFLVDRYVLPSLGIARTMASGSDKYLISVEKALKSKPPKNERHARRLQDGLTAIQAFRAISPINLGEVELLRPPKQPPMSIGGVKVVVNPQLLLLKKRATKEVSVGACRIHMVKGIRVEGEFADYFTTLLHWFAEERLGALGNADHRLCKVVDVLGANIVTAPKAYKQRRADLLAICEEIADRWDSILVRLKSAEELIPVEAE